MRIRCGSKGASPRQYNGALAYRKSPAIETGLQKTNYAAHPTVDMIDPGELPAVGSGSATPIAHEATRLVLLPSGPDTIHGVSLPETKPSTLPNRSLPDPGRASGGELGPARRSQVQGIAISPLSAAGEVYQTKHERPAQRRQELWGRGPKPDLHPYTGCSTRHRKRPWRGASRRTLTTIQLSTPGALPSRI